MIKCDQLILVIIYIFTLSMTTILLIVLCAIFVVETILMLYTQKYLPISAFLFILSFVLLIIAISLHFYTKNDKKRTKKFVQNLIKILYPLSVVLISFGLIYTIKLFQPSKITDIFDYDYQVLNLTDMNKLILDFQLQIQQIIVNADDGTFEDVCVMFLNATEDQNPYENPESINTMTPITFIKQFTAEPTVEAGIDKLNYLTSKNVYFYGLILDIIILDRLYVVTRINSQLLDGNIGIDLAKIDNIVQQYKNGEQRKPLKEQFVRYAAEFRKLILGEEDEQILNEPFQTNAGLLYLMLSWFDSKHLFYFNAVEFLHRIYFFQLRLQQYVTLLNQYEEQPQEEQPQEEQPQEEQQEEQQQEKPYRAKSCQDVLTELTNNAKAEWRTKLPNENGLYEMIVKNISPKQFKQIWSVLPLYKIIFEENEGFETSTLKNALDICAQLFSKLMSPNQPNLLLKVSKKK